MKPRLGSRDLLTMRDGKRFQCKSKDSLPHHSLSPGEKGTRTSPSRFVALFEIAEITSVIDIGVSER